MASEIAQSAQTEMLAESGSTGPISLRASEMSITVPEEDERLLLTIDQVELLCRGGRDRSFDWCMALFGAALGFSQNVVSLASSMIYDTEPRKLDIFLSLIFAVCIAGALAKFSEHKRNSTDMTVVLTKLRSGRKVNVR